MIMQVVDTAYTLQVVEVTLADRLDAHSAPEFRSVLKERLDRAANNVLVDLSAVHFVDSAGLAALVNTMKHARGQGGDLTLVRPRSDDAFRVFQLTRFDKVFTICGDLESARREIRGGR